MTKRYLLRTILFASSFKLYADNSAVPKMEELNLGDIKVVGNRPAESSVQPMVIKDTAKTDGVNTQKFSNAKFIEASPKRGNGDLIAPLVSTTPQDTTHSTINQVNNLPGVSVLGNAQTISQNINIGGLKNNNIYVGIDGINNYFSDFGHGHGDNETRLLPSPYLFKQVTASQTGSNITYGSGNLGGAVNFATIDPEDLLNGDKLSTQVSLDYNTVNNGTNGNAALAARTGKVSYLLNVVGMNANDTRLSDNKILNNSGNNGVQTLAKLGIDISKTQNMMFTFLGMENKGIYPGDNNYGSGYLTNLTLRQAQTMLDYTYKPNNPYINLAAKLYYQNSFYNSMPIKRDYYHAQPVKIDVNTLGVKLQNETKVVGQQLLYGLELTNISGSDAYSNGMANLPTANQQLYGLFLQDSWDITRKINLTVGTRFNAYNSKSDNYTNSGNFFTSQAAINYQFLPDWLVFAGISQGFTVPTIQQLYMSGDHPMAPGELVDYKMLANPNLQPQIGLNKTIGIKYASKLSHNQQVGASASAFLNDIDNYILSYDGTLRKTVDDVILVQSANLPKVQIYGYVLAANYVSPWVIVDTNFTLTYGSSQASTPNLSFGVGRALPIPPAKGYLAVTFPVEIIASQIKATLNYSLSRDNSGKDSNNPLYNIPAYQLVGLSYSWLPQGHLKGINFNAGVDNLFNQKYYTSEGEIGKLGLGRNIYAQVSYKY